MGCKKLVILLLCAMVLLAAAGAANADGAKDGRNLKVSIKAPDKVKSGETITILIEVQNEYPGPYYVENVRLYDGNALLKEWAYTQSDQQTAEKWYLTYEGNFTRPTTLRTEVRTSYGRVVYDTETLSVI